MGTVTTTRHFCDWCDIELRHRTDTTVFSGKVSRWENGPDVWQGEELCSDCDRALKALRQSRIEKRKDG